MALLEIAGLTGGVLLIVLSILLLAAIPLYIAVILLGGEVSLWTVMVAHVVAATLTAVATLIFPPLGGLVGIIVPLVVYKSMFDLDWARTILAYILQGVVAVVLVILLAVVGFASLGLLPA
ncbi:MAG: hypothetical protein SVU32_04420 [Candidatus Nanohaloarchaea archaeon]|nr:hypothetical protein [Candidatus Nanohaloarchaea archaeon]